MRLRRAAFVVWVAVLAATASDALRASCQGCHLRYAPALARRLGAARAEDATAPR